MRGNTIIAILIVLAGFVAVIYSTTREKKYPAETFEQKYKEQIRIGDSLRSEIIKIRLINDSLQEKSNRSDSLRKIFIDSLRSKFNDDEKADRIRAVYSLDDSASFEYFSKWLSKGDNN